MWPEKREEDSFRPQAYRWDLTDASCFSVFAPNPKEALPRPESGHDKNSAQVSFQRDSPPSLFTPAPHLLFLSAQTPAKGTGSLESEFLGDLR